jgi:oligoribonuclease
MTGLDADKDTILQIACYITDHNLNILDDKGFETTIHHEQTALDEMSPWCQVHHGSSGLTQRALQSDVTSAQAAQQLLEYIQKYVPTPKTALLAGNSVHADKMFLLKQPFSCVLEHLHYRILDVSAIKEAARRWSPSAVLAGIPPKRGLHEARADIVESIEEARYYKKILFSPLRHLECRENDKGDAPR